MRLSTRLALLAALASAPAFANTEILIHNVNAPGVGFNDTTPATPVGGNPGTTVGQQRLIAFQYAATIWGATVKSTVPIVIDASFTPLDCTADSAVLGAAGPTDRMHDFTNAPMANTWFSIALANARAGSDLENGSEISANFNSNLGQSNCLPGAAWYYGLDNNAPPNTTNLSTVLEHEFGHGLGFLTFVNAQAGTELGGLPDVFERHLFDDTIGGSGAFWDTLTIDQRATSALNPEHVSFRSPLVNQLTADGGVLAPNLVFSVNSPAGIAGPKDFGYTAFEPFPTAGLSGTLELAHDTGASTSFGCGKIDPIGAGHLAFVSRGPGLADGGAGGGTPCAFVQKILNAQDAGAVGVVVGDIDPVDTTPKITMAGDNSDKSITIPSIILSTPDSDAIRSTFTGGSSITVDFHNGTEFQGADSTKHLLVYTPSNFSPGSSVSHWTMTAIPSLLMQPFIHDDTPQGLDFTYPFMADIGWSVEGPVAIGLSKIDLNSVNPGGQARYLVVVVNHTKNPLTAVTVNATPPAGLTFVSNEGACTTGFPCSIASVPGEEVAAFVATYSVPADFSSASPVTFSATMTAAGVSPGPDLTADNSSPVQASNDLKVTATGPTSAAPGADVKVDATITNNGPSAGATITVTPVVKSGWTFKSFSGDCSGANCSFSSLAVGASKHVSATFNISDQATGTLTPGVTAATSGVDPDLGNNTGSLSLKVTGDGSGGGGGGGCAAPATAAGVPLALLALGLLFQRRQNA